MIDFLANDEIPQGTAHPGNFVKFCKKFDISSSGILVKHGTERIVPQESELEQIWIEEHLNGHCGRDSMLLKLKKK